MSPDLIKAVSIKRKILMLLVFDFIFKICCNAAAAEGEVVDLVGNSLLK